VPSQIDLQYLIIEGGDPQFVVPVHTMLPPLGSPSTANLSRTRPLSTSMWVSVPLDAEPTHSVLLVASNAAPRTAPSIGVARPTLPVCGSKRAA
jgi:hypothetical protein